MTLLENISSNCKGLLSLSFLQRKAKNHIFFLFFPPEENAILSYLWLCLRGEVQTAVQSNSVGYGWVVSSRVKITASQRKVREKKRRNSKRNCQRLKWSKANLEEWCWESQHFLKVVEEVLCSLVQVCSCEFTGLPSGISKTGKNSLNSIFPHILPKGAF